MLSIQSNMLAWNAGRQFKTNAKKNSKMSEKLSSGYRINRAADDAAGLSVSEKMRRQIRGLGQSADNIQDGVGYVQTAEGALSEIQDMLHRMNELAVKAANGTNTETDRQYIDREVQALKAEMDRIFQNTTFNERKIWEPNELKVLATTKKQAVEFDSTAATIDVTNDNCGIVAYGSYKVNADDQGVHISWTGYDGNAYETEKVDWDTLKKNHYSFEMSDYFGAKSAGNLLYDQKGNPVFKHRVAFTPQETATVDDMIACIDGTAFTSIPSADMVCRFEDNSGAAVTKNKVRVVSAALGYAAAYASNHNVAGNTQGNTHDFDAADDKFLEPVNSSGTLVQTLGSGGNLTHIANGTNSVNTAKNSTDTWSFSYYMDGIGKVTATSSGVSYYAPSDTADDDEHYWWDWSWRYSGGKLVQYKAYKTINSTDKGAGTLGSVMAALTGKKGESTPGLLTQANGGDCDNGGRVNLQFTLTADKAFTYGGNASSTHVGSFTLEIQVDSSDTENSVLQRINNALNANTIADLYTPSGSITYGQEYFGTPTARRKKIDVPIYGGYCGFYVQAGTESGQHIGVRYEALNVLAMGMKNTNVLTVEESGKAIDAIKEGLRMVSEQRADFGAYQNRLEHAVNVNENTEENTQASESVIRDTDIAVQAVEYSVNNILLQSGTSMLTQANQQADYILQLLQ